MPILYEDHELQPNPARVKKFSPSPSFWWGVAAGLTAGFFIFTALGREMVKTAAGLTEEEIRKRIEARKR